ncbi:hypothetical protein CSUI_005737 [Cystoisospora suis]|uniref:Uncharacterized protein n=1 Tax=Cystoisospora suis TaxID=483139 RepID=A0A2C6KW10_9APIC|nr:hypothetical protein CSUI_005737 [Cystoisospora suis]
MHKACSPALSPNLQSDATSSERRFQELRIHQLLKTHVIPRRSNTETPHKTRQHSAGHGGARPSFVPELYLRSQLGKSIPRLSSDTTAAHANPFLDKSPFAPRWYLSSAHASSSTPPNTYVPVCRPPDSRISYHGFRKGTEALPLSRNALKGVKLPESFMRRLRQAPYGSSAALHSNTHHSLENKRSAHSDSPSEERTFGRCPGPPDDLDGWRRKETDILLASRQKTDCEEESHSVLSARLSLSMDSEPFSWRSVASLEETRGSSRTVSSACSDVRSSLSEEDRVRQRHSYSSGISGDSLVSDREKVLVKRSCEPAESSDRQSACSILLGESASSQLRSGKDSGEHGKETSSGSGSDFGRGHADERGQTSRPYANLSSPSNSPLDMKSSLAEAKENRWYTDFGRRRSNLHCSGGATDNITHQRQAEPSWGRSNVRCTEKGPVKFSHSDHHQVACERFEIGDYPAQPHVHDDFLQSLCPTGMGGGRGSVTSCERNTLAAGKAGRGRRDFEEKPPCLRSQKYTDSVSLSSSAPELYPSSTPPPDSTPTKGSTAERTRISNGHRRRSTASVDLDTEDNYTNKSGEQLSPRLLLDRCGSFGCQNGNKEKRCQEARAASRLSVIHGATGCTSLAPRRVEEEEGAEKTFGEKQVVEFPDCGPFYKADANLQKNEDPFNSLSIQPTGVKELVSPIKESEEGRGCCDRDTIKFLVKEQTTASRVEDSTESPKPNRDTSGNDHANSVNDSLPPYSAFTLPPFHAGTEEVKTRSGADSRSDEKQPGTPAVCLKEAREWLNHSSGSQPETEDGFSSIPHTRKRNSSEGFFGTHGGQSADNRGDTSDEENSLSLISTELLLGNRRAQHTEGASVSSILPAGSSVWCRLGVVSGDSIPRLPKQFLLPSSAYAIISPSSHEGTHEASNPSGAKRLRTPGRDTAASESPETAMPSAFHPLGNQNGESEFVAWDPGTAVRMCENNENHTQGNLTEEVEEKSPVTSRDSSVRRETMDQKSQVLGKRQETREIENLTTTDGSVDIQNRGTLPGGLESGVSSGRTTKAQACPTKSKEDTEAKFNCHVSFTGLLRDKSLLDDEGDISPHDSSRGPLPDEHSACMKPRVGEWRPLALLSCSIRNGRTVLRSRDERSSETQLRHVKKEKKSFLKTYTRRRFGATTKRAGRVAIGAKQGYSSWVMLSSGTSRGRAPCSSDRASKKKKKLTKAFTLNPWEDRRGRHALGSPPEQQEPGFSRTAPSFEKLGDSIISIPNHSSRESSEKSDDSRKTPPETHSVTRGCGNAISSSPDLQKVERECSGDGRSGEPLENIYTRSNDGDSSMEARRYWTTELLPSAPVLSRYPFSTDEDKIQGILQSNTGVNLIPLAGETSCDAFLADSSPLSITSLSASRRLSSSSPEGVHRLASGCLSFSSRSSSLSNSDVPAEPDSGTSRSIDDVRKSKICDSINKKLSPSLLKLLVRCASRKSAARPKAQETTQTGTNGQATGTINRCNKRLSGGSASAGEERGDHVSFAATQNSNEVKTEECLSPSSSHLIFVAANQREISCSVEHTQLSFACTPAASFLSQERPGEPGQGRESFAANMSTFEGTGEISTRKETNSADKDLIHPRSSVDGIRTHQRERPNGRKTASHSFRKRSNSARGIAKRRPQKSGFEAGEGGKTTRREAPLRRALQDRTPGKDTIEEETLEEEDSHLNSSCLLHLTPTLSRVTCINSESDSSMISSIVLGKPVSPQQFPCSRAVSHSRCHRLQPETPRSPSALSRPGSCRSLAQWEALSMDRSCSSLNSSHPTRPSPSGLPLDSVALCVGAPSSGLSHLECFIPRGHSPCRSVSAPLSLESSSPRRGCGSHSRGPGQSNEKVEDEEPYESHCGQCCHTKTSVFRQPCTSARSSPSSSHDRLHLHTPVTSSLVTTPPCSPACDLSSSSPLFPCLHPPTDRLSTSDSRLSFSAPSPEHSAIQEQLPEPDIPPPGSLVDDCPYCPMPPESLSSPFSSLASKTTPEAFILHQAATLRKDPTRSPKRNPDSVPRNSEAPEAVCLSPSSPETLTANSHRAFCRNNTGCVTSSPSCARDGQAKATSDNVSLGARESLSILSSPKLGQRRRVTTPDVLWQLSPSLSAHGESCERQQSAFDDPYPSPGCDSHSGEEKLIRISQHDGWVASDSVPLSRRCESGCASPTVLQSPICGISDQTSPSLEGEPTATKDVYDSVSYRRDSFMPSSFLSSQGVEKSVHSHLQGHIEPPDSAILSPTELEGMNHQSVSRQDSSVFAPQSSSHPSRLPLVKQGNDGISLLKNDDSRTRTAAPFPLMSLSPSSSVSARESRALSTAEEEGTARGRPDEYIPTTTASSSAGVRNVSPSKRPFSSPEHLQGFLQEENGYTHGSPDSPTYPQLSSHDGRMECTPVRPLSRHHSSVSSSSGFSGDTSSSFLLPRVPSSDLFPPRCTLTPSLPRTSFTQHQADPARVLSCPVSPREASSYSFPSCSLVAALPSDLLLRSHVSSHLPRSYDRTCQPPLLSTASAFCSGTSSQASVVSPSFSPSCPPSSPATSVVPENREATSSPTSGSGKNDNGEEREKVALDVVEGKNAPASLTERPPARVREETAVERAAADVSADLPENQAALEDVDGAYEATEGSRDKSVEAFFCYVVDTIRGSDVCPTISLAKRFALEAANGGVLAAWRGEPQEKEEEAEQTTPRRGDENTTGNNGLASPGSQAPLIGDAGSPGTTNEVNSTARKATDEESVCSSRSGKENGLLLKVMPSRRSDSCPQVPVDDGRRVKDIPKEEQELGRTEQEGNQTAAFCRDADPEERREEDILPVEGRAMCKGGRNRTASRSREPLKDLYGLPNEEELRRSSKDVTVARMSTLRLWRTENLNLRPRVCGSSRLRKKRATKTWNHPEKREDATVCDAEGRRTAEAEEDLFVTDHSGEGIFFCGEDVSWLAPEEGKREQRGSVETVDYGKLAEPTGTLDGIEGDQGKRGGKVTELAEETSPLEQKFPGITKHSKEPMSHERRDDGHSFSSLYDDEQAKEPVGRKLQSPDSKTKREDCERMVEVEVEALEREREMLDVFLRSRAPTEELGDRESSDQGAINAKSHEEEKGDEMEKDDFKDGGEEETENSEAQREEDVSADKGPLQRRSSCKTEGIAHPHRPEFVVEEEADLKDTESRKAKKSDSNAGCESMTCGDTPSKEKMQRGKSNPWGSLCDLPKSIGTESELLDVIRMLLLRHPTAVSSGRLPTFFGGKEPKEQDAAARSVLASPGEETTSSRRSRTEVEETEEESSLQKPELERKKLAEYQTTRSSCLTQSPELSPRSVLSGKASGVVTRSRDNGENTLKDLIAVGTVVGRITEHPGRKDAVGEGKGMQAAMSDQGDACHGDEGKALLQQEDNRQQHSPGEENISGVVRAKEEETEHFKGDEQNDGRIQGQATRRIVACEVQSEANGSRKRLEKSRGEPIFSEKSLSEHRSFSKDKASEHKEPKSSLGNSDGSLPSPIPVPGRGEQDNTSQSPREDRQARKTRPFLITQNTSTDELNGQQEVLARTNIDEEEALGSSTDPDKDIAAGTPRTESKGEKAREASPESKPENHDARCSSQLGGIDEGSVQKGTKRSEGFEAVSQSRLAEEVIQDERNDSTSTGQDKEGDRVCHRDDVAEKNVRTSASRNRTPSQAPEEKTRGRGRSYKKTGLRPVSVKLLKKRLNSGVVIGEGAKKEERGNDVQEIRQTELSDTEGGSKEGKKALPEKQHRSSSLPDSDSNRPVIHAGNKREVNQAALMRGENDLPVKQTEQTESEMKETKAVVAVKKRVIRPLHRRDSTKFQNTCRSSSLLAEARQEKKGDESEKRTKERRSSLTTTDGQTSPETAEDDRGKEPATEANSIASTLRPKVRRKVNMQRLEELHLHVFEKQKRVRERAEALLREESLRIEKEKESLKPKPPPKFHRSKVLAAAMKKSKGGSCRSRSAFPVSRSQEGSRRYSTGSFSSEPRSTSLAAEVMAPVHVEKGRRQGGAIPLSGSVGNVPMERDSESFDEGGDQGNTQRRTKAGLWCHGRRSSLPVPQKSQGAKNKHTSSTGSTDEDVTRTNGFYDFEEGSEDRWSELERLVDSVEGRTALLESEVMRRCCASTNDCSFSTGSPRQSRISSSLSSEGSSLSRIPGPGDTVERSEQARTDRSKEKSKALRLLQEVEDRAFAVAVGVLRSMGDQRQSTSSTEEGGPSTTAEGCSWDEIEFFPNASALPLSSLRESPASVIAKDSDAEAKERIFDAKKERTQMAKTPQSKRDLTPGRSQGDVHMIRSMKQVDKDYSSAWRRHGAGEKERRVDTKAGNRTAACVRSSSVLTSGADRAAELRATRRCFGFVSDKGKRAVEGVKSRRNITSSEVLHSKEENISQRGRCQVEPHTLRGQKPQLRSGGGEGEKVATAGGHSLTRRRGYHGIETTEMPQFSASPCRGKENQKKDTIAFASVDSLWNSSLSSPSVQSSSCRMPAVGADNKRTSSEKALSNSSSFTSSSRRPRPVLRDANQSLQSAGPTTSPFTSSSGMPALSHRQHTKPESVRQKSISSLTTSAQMTSRNTSPIRRGMSTNDTDDGISARAATGSRRSASAISLCSPRQQTSSQISGVPFSERKAITPRQAVWKPAGRAGWKSEGDFSKSPRRQNAARTVKRTGRSPGLATARHPRESFASPSSCAARTKGELSTKERSAGSLALSSFRGAVDEARCKRETKTRTMLRTTGKTGSIMRAGRCEVEAVDCVLGLPSCNGSRLSTMSPRVPHQETRVLASAQPELPRSLLREGKNSLSSRELSSRLRSKSRASDRGKSPISQYTDENYTNRLIEKYAALNTGTSSPTSPSCRRHLVSSCSTRGRACERTTVPPSYRGETGNDGDRNSKESLSEGRHHRGAQQNGQLERSVSAVLRSRQVLNRARLMKKTAAIDTVEDSRRKSTPRQVTDVADTPRRTIVKENLSFSLTRQGNLKEKIEDHPVDNKVALTKPDRYESAAAACESLLHRLENVQTGFLESFPPSKPSVEYSPEEYPPQEMSRSKVSRCQGVPYGEGQITSVVERLIVDQDGPVDARSVTEKRHGGMPRETVVERREQELTGQLRSQSKVVQGRSEILRVPDRNRTKGLDGGNFYDERESERRLPRESANEICSKAEAETGPFTMTSLLSFRGFEPPSLDRIESLLARISEMEAIAGLTPGDDEEPSHATVGGTRAGSLASRTSSHAERKGSKERSTSNQSRVEAAMRRALAFAET